MKSKPATLTESDACERCGSIDVLEIAGKFLCGDCVSLAGSSCAGSADDNGC